MQKYNNSTKIIIGLDHGYGNIKTGHRIFRTGVECFEEEPIVSMNYIKYKDKYYVIGENHLIYQGNKTDSQDFFILTLAGLAEELKFRHLTMKSCAKWQNFLRKKNTYANAGISTRFLTVSPAAMISLP